MDQDIKNYASPIQVKIKNDTIKDEKKVMKKMYKQAKMEFVEENECTEIDPSNLSDICNEEIQLFSPATHDAWILQCPKSIDIDTLVKKRIKVPGRRYVGDIQVRTTQYKLPINHAIGYKNGKGKYALQLMPLSGHMMVSKRLNAEKPSTDGEASKYPKPCGPQTFKLPVRHPFFGRDYKSHIELDKKINKKLRNAEKKSAEATENIRTNANFYKIRSKLLATTQTLQQKEHAVRQSVLTGVAPDFLNDTAHPNYANLVNCQSNGVKVGQELKSPKRKVKVEIEIKEEPLDDTNYAEPITKKKKKSHKKNGLDESKVE